MAPNDFGTFALAATLNLIVDIRVKLQLDQKYLRDRDEHPELFDTFFSLSFGLAGISFGLLGIAGVLAVGLGRADLAICLLVFGLLGLLEPYSTSIRLSIEKQVAFRAVSFIQLFASTSQFVASLGGALAGWGLWSLLFGQGVGALVTVMWYLKIAPRRPRWRLQRALACEFLAYGMKYGAVYAISLIVLTQFDNFIIGLFSGTFLLGFYDRAYRTSLWPTLLVSSALGRISLPTYAQLQDDPVRLGKAFSMVLWTVLTLTTPLALVLLVTAPDLVVTLYGAKWLPSVPILQVLAAFSMFRPLWDDMVSILVATRRPGQMARLVFIQACVLIALAVPLTWFWGAVGTAVSVGIAFLISAGFLLYFGKTVLQINLMQNAFKPLFNSALALILFLGFTRIVPLDSAPAWFRFFSFAGLILLFYASVSWVSSRRDIVDRTRYIYSLVRGN
ncbi:MAG: oligosaccharide flippase family protein [Chloroflexi bacterium]|nr:oligosaccharide flippase family protein [Chloroflexota bacterium]